MAGTVLADSVKGRRGGSVHRPLVRSKQCHFWGKGEKVTETSNPFLGVKIEKSCVHKGISMPIHHQR